jgi:hypothetical protein
MAELAISVRPFISGRLLPVWSRSALLPEDLIIVDADLNPCPKNPLA